MKCPFSPSGKHQVGGGNNFGGSRSACIYCGVEYSTDLYGSGNFKRKDWDLY